MANENMANENIEDLCKDCGPTFTAFLEEMAAHNKETKEELENQAENQVVCPTCGKVHQYRPETDEKNVRPRAS